MSAIPGHGVFCACAPCAAVRARGRERAALGAQRLAYFRAVVPILFPRVAGGRACAVCDDGGRVFTNALARSSHERSRRHQRAALLAFMDGAYDDALREDRARRVAQLGGGGIVPPLPIVN